jgi:hypothetical protein
MISGKWPYRASSNDRPKQDGSCVYACITSVRKCLELQDGENFGKEEDVQARGKQVAVQTLCWSPCDVSVGVSGCMFGQTRLSKCVLTWNEMRTSRNDPIRYTAPLLSVTGAPRETVRPDPFSLAASASAASAQDGGGGATKMARKRLPCNACHRRTGQPH